MLDTVMVLHLSILNFVEQHGEIVIGDPVDNGDGPIAVTRLIIERMVKQGLLRAKKTQSWQEPAWCLTDRGMHTLVYGKAA